MYHFKNALFAVPSAKKGILGAALPPGGKHITYIFRTLNILALKNVLFAVPSRILGAAFPPGGKHII